MARRKPRKPKDKKKEDSGTEIDIERELVRIYQMIMEDLEHIRRHEREEGQVVVNKYLYYDQANRVLGQIILLKYKYEVNTVDPWEKLAELLGGSSGEAGVDKREPDSE